MLAIFLGMRLGVAHHLRDLVLVQGGRGGDRHLLFLPSPKVLGPHVEDPVGVDVEGHLDLRDAAGCRRDAVEVELAQGLVG